MAPTAATPLLLLTPLISQTAFTTLALLEWIFFRPFMDPRLSPAALQVWFARFIPPGLMVVFTFGGIAAGMGGRASWMLGGWQGGWEGGARYYILGTIFSAGHFIFGPWDLPIMDRLVNSKPFPSPPTIMQPTWGVPPTRSTGTKDKAGEPTAKEELKRWLTLHYARTFLTDVPAMLLFLKGALKEFS